MDNVIANHREAAIVEMLREIESEMTRLQSLIDESQAHLEAFQHDKLFSNAT